VGAEGALSGLRHVEGLEGDGPDLVAALGLVERGVVEDLHHPVGEGTQLLGGRAGPRGGGEEGGDEDGREQRRRREPADQATTLISACRSARPVNGFSSTWARILARKRHGSGSSMLPVMNRKRPARSGRRVIAA
jgi:hypothetical protein